MTSKIALILLSALGATAALPAIAPAVLALDHLEQHLDFDSDLILSRLQAKGVNATSVEEWSGLIRAYVDVDGRQVMQFFDPDTLQHVDA